MDYLWVLAVCLSAVGATTPCPGGSECPGAETCCLLQSGSYGCCPFSSAVCCSDRQHCCPSGYQCALDRCERQANATAVNSFKKENLDHLCPNKKDRCLNHSTCCPVELTGRYGCCPMANAVCCDDKEHCCPLGSRCNIAKQRCEQGDLVWPLVRKEAYTALESAKSLLKETTPATTANTACLDPHYSCPGRDTCCRTPGGTWTCCVYPYGTCCIDGVHCCPYGMHCIQNYCVKGNVTVSTPASLFAKDNSVNAESIICPDKHQCPNGNTCCKLSSGDYGCCPLPSAVCCSDEIHCCPQGYICNPQSGTCSDAIREIPWSTKTPAF